MTRRALHRAVFVLIVVVSFFSPRIAGAATNLCDGTTLPAGSATFGTYCVPIGIGTSTPTNALTINGTEGVQFGANYFTTGTQSDVSIGTTMSSMRYTGTGAAVFNGIAAGQNGQLLYINNDSNYTLTLNNESGSEATVTNQIVTGTGGSLTIGTNSSVMLQYDGSATNSSTNSGAWRVVGSSNSSNGAGAGTAWEQIASADISSAATSYTFNGLNGDSDIEYMLVGRLVSGTSSAGWCFVQPNGDTTAGDYGEELGQAAGSTANAVQVLGTNAGFYFIGAAGSGQTSYATAYLYGKSGYARTFLSQQSYGISGVSIPNSFFMSGVWNVTSAISSLAISCTNASQMGAGTHLELWAPRSVGGSGGGGGSGTVSVGSQYQMAYYATAGSSVSGDSRIVTDANNDLLVSVGSVGIGTANPVGALTIHDSGGGNNLTIAPTFAGTAYYNISGSGGAFGTAKSMTFNVPSSNGFEFAVNGADQMVINPSGLVGIGTSAPYQALQVAGNVDVTGTNGYITEVANAGTTGTTVNKLAKVNSSGAVITATTDNDGVLGVVVGETSGGSSAVTTGNAEIAFGGQVYCTFDTAPSTVGDFVGISGTTGGDCKDVGSTRPTFMQTIGRVLSTTASGGNYLIALQPNGIGTGGGQLVGTYSSSCGGSWPLTCGTTYTVAFTGTANAAPTLSGTTLKLPSNTAYYVVEIWGGGGGGGASWISGSAYAGGAGGGGGGYAEKLYTSQTSQTFSIGSGSGQATTGSNTTFASMTANGGGGGGNAPNAIGGSGGTASGGDVNIAGGAGGTVAGSVVNAGQQGASGGAAARGGGGATDTGSFSGNGGTGNAYGGGGSGAGNAGTTLGGGTGGAGGITVWVYTTVSGQVLGGSMSSGGVCTSNGSVINCSNTFSNNVVPKGSTSSGLVASSITDDGTQVYTAERVGIGTSLPNAALQVGNGGPVVQIIDGSSSGNAGGGGIYIWNGQGNTVGAFGNYSAIMGGAYTSAMEIYAPSNLIIPSGNVGIGTTTPQTGLDVQYGLRTLNDTAGGNVPTGGAGIEMEMVSGQGYIIAYNRTTSTGLPLAISGSNWSNSDSRLKTNITDLDDADGLSAIEKLRPVSFHWRDAETDKNQGKQIGLIAQDIQKTFPNLVTVNKVTPNASYTSADGKKETVENALTVKYEGFIVPLIKAVQELKFGDDTRDQEIAELKATNKTLEAAVKKADDDHLDDARSIEQLKKELGELKHQTGTPLSGGNFQWNRP